MKPHQLKGNERKWHEDYIAEFFFFLLFFILFAFCCKFSTTNTNQYGWQLLLQLTKHNDILRYLFLPLFYMSHTGGSATATTIRALATQHNTYTQHRVGTRWLRSAKVANNSSTPKALEAPRTLRIGQRLWMLLSDAHTKWHKITTQRHRSVGAGWY